MIVPSAKFSRIASGGAGNPRSRVAHACAEFLGDVFLGATHPNGDTPEDCARILRYGVATREWKEVYRAPLVAADEVVLARDVLRSGNKRPVQVGQLVPHERGFRGMTVFQGRSDKSPALYVSTISNWGGQFLRCVNGESFQVVSEPGLGDERLLSFRTLVPFAGRLFTSPIGSVSGDQLDRNLSVRPTVFVSDDPARGVWREASLPGFGDDRNRVIFQMAVLGNHLYAGTGNPVRGFELWRTDGRGKPPYRWELIIERGAWRHTLNASVASMVAFKGALYIGTGLPGLGYDKANDIGPAAAELLRVFPDGRWELVIGEPRFSPQGLQVPLGCMGPGFDEPCNSVFWRMAVRGDQLYVGTHNWRIYKYLMLQDDAPRGGFHLWATRDGGKWEALTMDGFGNPYAVGVRTLLPTRDGLYLGTDDHSLLRKRARKLGPRLVDTDQTPSGFEMWFGESVPAGEKPILAWG